MKFKFRCFSKRSATPLRRRCLTDLFAVISGRLAAHLVVRETPGESVEVVDGETDTRSTEVPALAWLTLQRG